MQRLKVLFNLVMLAGLTMLFSSCGSKTLILHAIKNPVMGKDIYVIPNGDTCMSPWYLENILGVKIENKTGQ